jgi:YVTN family beta-propeller protein
MALHRLLLIMVIQTMTSSLIAAPFIYVTNPPDETVSVIDAATNTVVKTISGFNTPFFQAITPDDKFDYVTNILNNTVSVIDIPTNTIVNTINSAQFDIPFGISVAITPSGQIMYVANNTLSGNGTVSRIDVATNMVIGSAIPVGLKPAVIVITPNEQFAYVNNSGDNTISVIDITTNTVIDTISSGQFSGLTDMVITPDGNTLYVTNAFVNTVSRIDTITNTVVGSAIAVGNFPQGLAISPDGKTIYVMNTGDNTVSLIDVATNTVIGSPIIVGNAPEDMAITPDGSIGYVVNRESDNVSVIDLATNTVIFTIPVGHLPFSIVSTLAVVIGVIRTNIFLNKTESILQITWNQFSPNAVLYRIFNSNGDIIGTVSAQGPLEFFVCFISITEIEGITVAAVSPTGTESVHIPVTIL